MYSRKENLCRRCCGGMGRTRKMRAGGVKRFPSDLECRYRKSRRKLVRTDREAPLWWEVLCSIEGGIFGLFPECVCGLCYLDHEASYFSQYSVRNGDLESITAVLDFDNEESTSIIDICKFNFVINLKGNHSDKALFSKKPGKVRK